MAMIHLEPQTLEMFSRALDGLKPPPNLSLSQWADKYRKLSAEASASQGQWNTDAAPFQREIMDAMEVAKALYVREVTERTAEFEPRVQVVRVDWLESKLKQGEVIPKVVYELV